MSVGFGGWLVVAREIMDNSMLALMAQASLRTQCKRAGTRTATKSCPTLLQLRRRVISRGAIDRILRELAVLSGPLGRYETVLRSHGRPLRVSMTEAG